MDERWFGNAFQMFEATDENDSKFAMVAYWQRWRRMEFSRRYIFRDESQGMSDRAELSTGRMDPRVGSGRVWSGRVTILPDFGGSGRVNTSDFKVFYWLFFGTWIDMNLRILHSDWLIFYDIKYIIIE